MKKKLSSIHILVLTAALNEYSKTSSSSLTDAVIAEIKDILQIGEAKPKKAKSSETPAETKPEKAKKSTEEKSSSTKKPTKQTNIFE